MATPRNPNRDDLRITEVLEALSHPLRLLVVHRLAQREREGEEMSCGDLLPEVSKSTASHHWRVLRESGVVHQRRDGRRLLLHLRRADLDARFPGVLDGVLVAAERDPGVAGAVDTGGDA
ncbi:helix-turn-helix domain-containing protein [Streptomyces sp. NPDC020742]|uniref:ArsR/SmtB family transcription factor n=1 Tax=Streptomyces sp. NPDC020742 TaxID=3154897 RepID=UPI0033E406F4